MLPFFFSGRPRRTRMTTAEASAGSTESSGAKSVTTTRGGALSSTCTRPFTKTIASGCNKSLKRR